MTNNPDSTSLDARCYVIEARTSSFSSTLFSIGASRCQGWQLRALQRSPEEFEN
jgi:hypothetical protein